LVSEVVGKKTPSKREKKQTGTGSRRLDEKGTESSFAGDQQRKKGKPPGKENQLSKKHKKKRLVRKERMRNGFISRSHQDSHMKVDLP